MLQLRLRLSPIIYHRIAVAPIALCHLKDASALLLPLGQLGTLWNLTNSLIALSVSEKEKEVIAAQMCLEVRIVLVYMPYYSRNCKDDIFFYNRWSILLGICIKHQLLTVISNWVSLIHVYLSLC
jgi:predicted membrane-bound mannosyltransferase